jgi:hypothetical protein
MAPVNRPRFKKNPGATGLARIAEPYSSTAIIRKGAEVGQIRPPHRNDADYTWSVSLIVTDAEAKPGWKWVKLKARFTTEPAAREWLIKNWPAIAERYALRGLD